MKKAIRRLGLGWTILACLSATACTEPEASGGPYTPDTCRTAGGNAYLDPGDGSIVKRGCPDGRQLLGYMTHDFIEGGLCCGPTRQLTVEECSALGGLSFADPGDGSLMKQGCPNDCLSIGYMKGFIEGGLCCKPSSDSSNTATCI